MGRIKDGWHPPHRGQAGRTGGHPSGEAPLVPGQGGGPCPCAGPVPRLVPPDPYHLPVQGFARLRGPAKAKLKEEFLKNAHIKDVRVIDMKVIQGQQELQELANHWQEAFIVMSKWFKEKHIDERPKDFMSKFL